MVRIIIALTVSITFFVFFLTLGIDVGHEGKFEYEGKIGNYNSGELVNVKDIRDGVASLSIDGKSVLMKAGEVYEFKDIDGVGIAGKSDYRGTVTIKEVNEDSVIAIADVEKTMYFYVFNATIVALFSLAIGAFIMVRPNKVRSENNGNKVSEAN